MPVDADDGRHADGQVEVGRSYADHLLENLCDVHSERLSAVRSP